VIINSLVAFTPVNCYAAKSIRQIIARRPFDSWRRRDGGSKLLPACRWLGSVMASASDLWSEGREFDSQPVHCSGQVVHTNCASVTKQYNLVPAKGRWCSAARKVTVGPASHRPCVTDFVVYPPTGSMATVWEMSTSPTPSGHDTFTFTALVLIDLSVISICSWITEKFTLYDSVTYGARERTCGKIPVVTRYLVTNLYFSHSKITRGNKIVTRYHELLIVSTS